MNIWLSNIIRLVVCVLLQVLLFNNLALFGVCTPYVYILFLISLPIELPRWAELLIGTFTGLVMDIFCSSLGVNLSACILVTYLRPLMINIFVQDKERLSGTVDINKIGLIPYMQISAILIASHHIVMFILENMNPELWWLTLIKIAVSSIATFAIIIGFEILKK